MEIHFEEEDGIIITEVFSDEKNIILSGPYFFVKSFFIAVTCKKLIHMNKSSFLLIFSILFLFLASCKQQEKDLTPDIEAAVKNLALSLQADPPTASNINERIRVYLNAQPTTFFGATVALLDTNGVVTTSPYWYRKGGILVNKELNVPSYNINTLEWLRKPIDTKLPQWTTPYFDAGGGDIWMKSYSYPVIVNNKVIAVAETDLAVDKP